MPVVKAKRKVGKVIHRCPSTWDDKLRQREWWCEKKKGHRGLHAFDDVVDHGRVVWSDVQSRETLRKAKVRVEGVGRDKVFEAITGVKFDEDKPNLDLLSYVAALGEARVLTFGKKKYAADNWRKGMEWRRLIRAAIGHIMAFGDGEDLDPESGLPHIDHAACCIMFLSEYQKKGLGTDDRWKGPVKP